MSELFYKEILQAKNGSKIPAFTSGKAAHSKYAPEREAQSFLGENHDLLFAAIVGVGGGYHIESFCQRNPQCKVIAVEKNQADLDFLRQNIPSVQKLFQNKKIIFAAADVPGQLESAIEQNYFPAVDGDLKIAALRPWADEAGADYDKILERAKAALKKISADYSVQARFGGLWQKNVFCNLLTLKKAQESAAHRAPAIDASKTAAIVAAGPTLDQTILQIERERKNYFVIATDTGYKILCRRGIKADAVVSIDAQFLSAQHFCAAASADTIFVLDLAANPSIARAALENSCKIIFTNGGHPLISFASLFCKQPFLRLQSGGGTVAIAAADFAKSCGFEKIQIFGADFGYSSGKPYARGSYLDDLYRAGENRLNGAETAFARLMLRAPLKMGARGFLQTDVMLCYQKTMEEFLSSGRFALNGFLYECNFARAQNSAQALQDNGFDFARFKTSLEQALLELNSSDELLPQSALILPSIAFYKNKFGANKISTKEAKKLALNKILLYNKLL